MNNYFCLPDFNKNLVLKVNDITAVGANKQ